MSQPATLKAISYLLLVSLNAVTSHHSSIYTSNLPKSKNYRVGTYANDNALLLAFSNHTIASQQLQTLLNTLSQWFTNCKIKMNKSKQSSFVTFTLRPHNYPDVSINNIIFSHSNEVKYLGLTFDWNLTWSLHLKDKRKKLNSRLHL